MRYIIAIHKHDGTAAPLADATIPDSDSMEHVMRGVALANAALSAIGSAARVKLHHESTVRQSNTSGEHPKVPTNDNDA